MSFQNVVHVQGQITVTVLILVVGQVSCGLTSRQHPVDQYSLPDGHKEPMLQPSGPKSPSENNPTPSSSSDPGEHHLQKRQVPYFPNAGGGGADPMIALAQRQQALTTMTNGLLMAQQYMNYRHRLNDDYDYYGDSSSEESYENFYNPGYGARHPLVGGGGGYPPQRYGGGYPYGGYGIGRSLDVSSTDDETKKATGGQEI